VLYHTRAQLHALRGDRAAACRDFRQAIAHELTGGGSERLASDYVELAQLQHIDGDYQPALASLDDALRARPDYAPAHRQRAETLLALDRYREAGEALDRYLQCRGTPTAEVYHVGGLIHAALREYAEAVDAYGWALALRPDARTLADRGRAYLKLDAVRLALRDFDAALKLEPAQADALSGRGFARVCVGERTAGLKDAEAALTNALATGPGTPELMIRTACTYARAVGQLRGQPTGGSVSEWQKRAVELVRHALEQVPPARQRDFWQAYVVNEKELQPIRDCDEMLELKRKYAP
jgi:tetratricopeptide (TPR) repeat protein